MSGARSVLITKNSCMSSPIFDTWNLMCPAGTFDWSGVTMNSCKVTLTVVMTGVGVGAGWNGRKHCSPRKRIVRRAHWGSGPLFGRSCARQKVLPHLMRHVSGVSHAPVVGDLERHRKAPAETGQRKPDAPLTVYETVSAAFAVDTDSAAAHTLNATTNRFIGISCGAAGEARAAGERRTRRGLRRARTDCVDKRSRRRHSSADLVNVRKL